jgi:hypothetical protein
MLQVGSRKYVRFLGAAAGTPSKGEASTDRMSGFPAPLRVTQVGRDVSEAYRQHEAIRSTGWPLRFSDGHHQTGCRRTT